MEEDEKLCPSLSGNPKVKVSYGNGNLTEIIESLILLDLQKDNYEKGLNQDAENAEFNNLWQKYL